MGSRTGQPLHPVIRKNWFLSLAAARLTSLVPASACSAPGFLEGKRLCHGSVTEDSELEQDREKTESLHKPEHEETDSLLSGKGSGEADPARE